MPPDIWRRGLIILLMTVTLSQIEDPIYTHEYQSEVQYGSVSNETGPVELKYPLRAYSVNIFEFNCSENDTIIVRIWDSNQRQIICDPFNDEIDYLIINDTTKEDPLMASPDGIYFNKLPGWVIKYDGDLEEELTIELQGDGNYTVMVHWRELEEWEKSHWSHSVTRNYFIFFLTGIIVLLILITVAMCIGFSIWKKRRVILQKNKNNSLKIT